MLFHIVFNNRLQRYELFSLSPNVLRKKLEIDFLVTWRRATLVVARLYQTITVAVMPIPSFCQGAL